VLRRIWPRLAPHELVHDLLGARPLLRAAGKGLFSDDELRLLFRPRSASLEDVAWTAADTALVDEARAALGPVRHARRPSAANGTRDPSEPLTVVESGDDEVIRSYGHIVVDEVQDLSAMQLRMLARRSISGSMTVVGDIAQATAPGVPSSWDLVIAHLAPRREPSTVELTVSYRTPKEELDVAARVLAVAEPGLRTPIPVRTTGFPPDLRVVERDAIGDELIAAVTRELTEVADGRVAVLVAPRDYDDVMATLRTGGIDAVDPRVWAGEGLAAHLVVLPSSVANGLEFDSVLVVEPAHIASHPGSGDEFTARGLRMLYVAITRSTRRLTVLGTVVVPFLEPSDTPPERWHAEAVIH
jgi:DNA helicase IV